MLRPCFFRRPHTYQHWVFLFELLQPVYLHCATWTIWPPLLMQHSRLTLAFRPLIFLPLISYLLPIHSPNRLMLPAVFFLIPDSSSFPDSLKVLQWNGRGLRARRTKLLHFISSHLVDLICIQEFNLNHLLFGSLDFLLCYLIAPTPGLAFFLIFLVHLTAYAFFYFS